MEASLGGMAIQVASRRILVNASAIGYYGPHGDDELTEDAPAGNDFLAGTCMDWERAAQNAEPLGVRVVLLRIGLVLDKEGGALARMLKPFKLCIGGPTGSGMQWVSWIHHDDLVGIILLALDHPGASGPINATTSHPVRNREFAAALGRALHRPAVLPTPTLVLRLMLGEAAQVITTGQRVCPPGHWHLAICSNSQPLTPRWRMCWRDWFPSCTVALRSTGNARKLRIGFVNHTGGLSMSRKSPKTAVVAFKVEKELADLLDKLPNKSAFIRKAIAAQLGMACPAVQRHGSRAPRCPRSLRSPFWLSPARGTATGAVTTCCCREKRATSGLKTAPVSNSSSRVARSIATVAMKRRQPVMTVAGILPLKALLNTSVRCTVKKG